MKTGFAIVVDIGKTLAKVTLWSRTGELVARETRPNAVTSENGIRRLDAQGIEAWLTSALASFASHPVEYIVPVAHGAAFAALVDDQLAFAPFDYEQVLPADVDAAYNQVRPSFADTGSPKLPAGLNLGAQIFWAEQEYPAAMAQATLLPWAQYWSWLLSGEATSEPTSLGCHTDLWLPSTSGFSNVATARGWDSAFAPLASAGQIIGNLRPELARRTGLSPMIKVLAGLHDSNAALNAARGFHQIENRDATILSTGTWFIAMRLAQSATLLETLPESRDCLVNVDVFGRPVPSARFMGGREIETLIEIDTRQVDIKPDQPRLLASVPDVLARKSMVLPTLAPGNGPFPGNVGGWVNRPHDWFARRAGACLYAALVADTSLNLIGSQDCLLVEGRFAEAEVFVRALAALRPAQKVYVANAHNDVSFGALRLIDPEIRPKGGLSEIAPLSEDLGSYRELWVESQAEAAKVA